MLKRLRTAHPILYCILSEVLFLGSMVVFSLLATIGLAAAGADFDTMDGYLFGSVQEAVGLAVALLLLARTGRLDALGKHHKICDTTLVKLRFLLFFWQVLHYNNFNCKEFLS